MTGSTHRRRWGAATRRPPFRLTCLACWTTLAMRAAPVGALVALGYLIGRLP